MKIQEPKVSRTQEYNLLDAYKENNYNNMLFKNNINEYIKISNNTFDSCIFNNIDFNNIELNNIELIDVIFENCDL